eukprot:jgi/Bigna1/129970/aug1.10_g4678
MFTRQMKKRILRIYKKWKRKTPSNNRCPITLQDFTAAERDKTFDLVSQNMRRTRYIARDLAQFYMSQNGLFDPSTREPINSAILLRLERASGVAVHSFWKEKVLDAVREQLRFRQRESVEMIQALLQTHPGHLNSIHILMQSNGIEGTSMEFTITSMLLSAIDPEHNARTMRSLSSFLEHNARHMESLSCTNQEARTIAIERIRRESKEDVIDLRGTDAEVKAARESKIQAKIAQIREQHIDTKDMENVWKLTKIGIAFLQSFELMSRITLYTCSFDALHCSLNIRVRPEHFKTSLSVGSELGQWPITRLIFGNVEKKKQEGITIWHSNIVPSRENQESLNAANENDDDVDDDEDEDEDYIEDDAADEADESEEEGEQGNA